jgi:hypothetical protein
MAADLTENKKLSLDTLIILQYEKEKIQRIRENLQSNSDAYKCIHDQNGFLRKFIIQHAGLRGISSCTAC